MLLSQRRRSVPDADKQSGCAVPTMVLSETFRLSLFLVIRGGIGFLERLGARGTRSLTGLWILTLEPERLENQPVIIRDESGRTLDRRSSCLLFQMFGVETDSFLPNDQSDGRDLARHRWLHSLGYQRGVELLERSRNGSGPRRGSLEDV